MHPVLPKATRDIEEFLSLFWISTPLLVMATRRHIPRTLGNAKAKNSFVRDAEVRPSVVPGDKPHDSTERAKRVSQTSSASAAPRVPLSVEDIESFKALGVEVCLTTDDGNEVWLVPERTSEQRAELAPEDLQAIARVVDVFPDAHVAAVRKPKQQA